MDTLIQSLLKLINPRLYRFGTKINILVFALITICILVISLVGFRYFKEYIYTTNQKNLEELATIKKNNLEKDFQSFLSTVPSIITENIAFTTENLIANYKDFAYERYEYFRPDTLSNFNKRLKDLYIDEVIENTSWEKPKLTDIFPTDNLTIVLQNIYLVDNLNAYGEKEKLDRGVDQSTYSNHHEQLHHAIKEIARKDGVNNIYIIDSRKGNIIYCYDKNIAFGQNIYDSYLKHTSLATSYHKALSARNKNHTVITDFENFAPALNKPVSFLSLPVFYSEEKIAVLILELSPEFFESMIYTNQLTENNGVSYYLVGEDHILRTNDADKIKNPEAFFKKAKKLAKSNAPCDKAYKLLTGSTALQLYESINLAGNHSSIVENYLNDKVFLQILPVNLSDLKWSFVAQLSSNYSLAFFRKVKMALLIACAFLLLFAVFITRFFRESILERLNILKSSMQKLVKGEDAENFENKWRDELGDTIDVFNVLNERIVHAGEFALQLSEGNYHQKFISQSSGDKFATALNTLKERLEINQTEAEKRSKEDHIRNWTNEGIAKFNDLLRQSNSSIQNLSYMLIENLISYLGANLGGVFLVEGEQEFNKKINLIASYAFDRKKYHSKSIEIGEGLIGNCYLEKKPIHIKRIPEDYIEIVSGMGRTIPKALYIVPLMIDSEVLGIVEIASLEDFEDYKVDFINKLAENIASTFASVKLNSKTAELLEESKRRANEIAQQEEEMRQNLEEMQATQEELARLRSEDEQRTQKLKAEIDNSNYLVQQLLNSMEGEVYIKDEHGIIILANELAAIRFNTIPEKLYGKTDHDLFSLERLEKEQQFDKQVLIEGGIVSGEITEHIGDKEQKYFIIKQQFYIQGQKSNGILTTRVMR